MIAGMSRVLVLPDETPIETVKAEKVVKRDSGIYVPVYDTNAKEFSYQTATVIAVPMIAEERIDDDDNGMPVYERHKVILEPGQKVITHHMLRDGHVNVKIKDVDYTALYYHQVFAIIDGDKLICNCNWNFIEPLVIEKPETHDVLITLKQKAVSETYGYVRFLSDSLKRLGVKEGDLVGIEPNTNYEILWNDKSYYRIATENICVVIDNAKSIA
jgi:co-chaperonin GroES (HSP10)